MTGPRMGIHQDVIAGLTLAQAGGLGVYAKHRTSETDDVVCDYVNRVAAQLPVLFRFAMITIAVVIGIVALPLLGTSSYRSGRGQRVLNRLTWVPGFRVLVKFVRATCYLRLFDALEDGPGR